MAFFSWALVGMMALAVVTAGCFGGRDAATEEEGRAQGAGSTPSGGAGSGADGSEAEGSAASFTTYNETGHFVADAVDSGADPGGEDRGMDVPVPVESTAIIGELEWSGTAGDLDLYLLSPAFCPPGPGQTNLVLQLVCNLSWRLTSDSAGSYGADGGTTDPSEAYLRIEIDSDTIAREACDEAAACDWRAHVYPNVVANVDWDLRVTVFREAPPDGFSAFEGRSNPTTG